MIVIRAQQLCPNFRKINKEEKETELNSHTCFEGVITKNYSKEIYIFLNAFLKE